MLEVDWAELSGDTKSGPPLRATDQAQRHDRGAVTSGAELQGCCFGNTSCLPPIASALALIYAPILARTAWISQGFPIITAQINLANRKKTLKAK